MLSPKIARAAAAAVCAVAAAAGCDSADETPEPDGLISITTMRGALLQGPDIGGSWRAPAASSDPQRLVAFCGGTATAPPVPPGGEVVAVPLVDEGDKGAQTLHQTALVYPDASAAGAGLASLRAVADGCPATVNQPARTTADRNEPAYTETSKVLEMNEGGWSGFVITRHKAYEPKHPGTADTAVAVVAKSNVLIVESYAVYRLGNASASPSFDNDWKKLLGTVLNRVG